VESTGTAEVIATHEGHAVAVRQGNILALCFHPELTSDRRLHQELVKMAGAR
jgi:5'-phosphate synthase pdxT subunit